MGSCQVPRLGSKALHDPVPSCLFESMCSTYCRHAGFLSFWLWQTWPFSIFTSFSMLYLDCCPHPHLEQDPVMAFLLHGPSPAQSSSSYALVPLILSMLSLCQWWSRHSVLPWIAPTTCASSLYSAGLSFRKKVSRCFYLFEFLAVPNIGLCT